MLLQAQLVLLAQKTNRGMFTIGQVVYFYLIHTMPTKVKKRMKMLNMLFVVAHGEVLIDRFVVRFAHLGIFLLLLGFV